MQSGSETRFCAKNCANRIKCRACSSIVEAQPILSRDHARTPAGFAAWSKIDIQEVPRRGTSSNMMLSDKVSLRGTYAIYSYSYDQAARTFGPLAWSFAQIASSKHDASSTRIAEQSLDQVTIQRLLIDTSTNQSIGCGALSFYCSTRRELSILKVGTSQLQIFDSRETTI